MIDLDKYCLDNLWTEQISNKKELLRSFKDKKVRIALMEGYERSPRWCSYLSIEIYAEDYKSRYTFDHSVYDCDEEGKEIQDSNKLMLECISSIMDFLDGNENDSELHKELKDCLEEATKEFLEEKERLCLDKTVECWCCKGRYDLVNLKEGVERDKFLCMNCKSPILYDFSLDWLRPTFSDVLTLSKEILDEKWKRYHEFRESIENRTEPYPGKLIKLRNSVNEVKND